LKNIWLLAGLASCLQNLPGAEDMGRYAVHAELLSRSCQIEEISKSYADFEMQLSRNPVTGQAYATLKGAFSREGTFDGQIHDTRVQLRRTFASCAPCEGVLQEQMRFAILSRSQSDLLSKQCPPDALDGGLLALDGGVSLPSMTSSGYDAVRVCGEIQAGFVFDSDTDNCPTACTAPCESRFEMTGVRQ
jgi:hypothetical protein